MEIVHEEKMHHKLHDYKKNTYGALALFLLVATLFVGMKFVSEIREFGLIGRTEVSTISLSGYGEVQAVPDIANIYFTISNDAKTAKEAQSETAKIENAALAFLRENNIEDKDIKTTNASFYPKYEYKYNTVSNIPCSEYSCPPRGGKNVIVGYTSSESITVKVRNTDDAGALIEGLSALGVSNLSGPNFSIDNEEDLKAEARREAIKNAKEKAEALASDLGVKLGKVVYFNESDGHARPYAMDMAMNTYAAKEQSASELPKGENTVSSSVSITYEIR